jgi:hypothetical protein
MPKLVCLCGYVHDLTPIPDAGYVVVRDGDYESLVEAERTLASRSGDDTLLRTIVSLQSRLYECPGCGRLAWMKKSDEVVFFHRDDEPPPEVAVGEHDSRR